MIAYVKKRMDFTPNNDNRIINFQNQLSFSFHDGNNNSISGV